MKLQKLAAIAFTTVFLLGLVIAGNHQLDRGIVEETKAQTVEQKKDAVKPSETMNASTQDQDSQRNGARLTEEIKNEVKGKESSWELSFDLKGPSGTSDLTWKSQRQRVEVFIQEHSSEEKASQSFDLLASPFACSICTEGKPQQGFGDKAFLRTAIGGVKDLPVQLAFKSGNYVVRLRGEKANIFRFAKHILSVLDAQQR